MILDHIERARRMGLPYVYLGYWVHGSRKMDYKGRFLPQERLTPDGWRARSRLERLSRTRHRIKQLDVQDTMMPATTHASAATGADREGRPSSCGRTRTAPAG